MNAVKRALTLIVVGLTCAMSRAAVLDEEAKQLLLRSLQHAYHVNVQAIVVQYCPESGSLQQLKVEQTRTGHSRYTVLCPLQDQGVESVDDGTRAVTYLPDNKLVLIQASCRSEAEDANERLDRAEKNYRMSQEDSPDIAGRHVLCVVATPRSAALEERRFYIDSKTAYLLRSETVSKNGEHHLKYNTKNISYPETMAEPTVETHRLGAKTVHSAKLVALFKTRPATQVGFEPVIPNALPYGFAVNAAHVTTLQNKWQAVVVRVSDGLARGVVYEWKPTSDSRDEAPAPDRSTLRARGLRLMMVADIPRPAREKILRAFATYGLQTKASELDEESGEPNRVARLFNNSVGLHAGSYVQPLSAS